MRRKLGRRRFLRGAGGFTMALPFLELLAPNKVRAADKPRRYAFLFAGFSIGSADGQLIAPATTGPWDPTLPRALTPLSDHGVAEHVKLVSGLEIPAASTAPAGGRIPPFHSTSHQVLTTGHRYEGGQLAAPSSEWIAANTIAEGTRVLNYRAQPVFYYPDSEGLTDGIISARIGAGGELEQVPPVTSPRLAYESLFDGFVPPDAEGALQAQRALEMRKSVVDLVADDAGSLIPRLGKADQLRMQRHFDELRSLEKRLETLELPEGTACQMLPHPGDDPPVGDTINPGAGGSYQESFMNETGWSDEDLRADIMVDLIHMAFACDISRVASFMITYAQCFLNMYQPLGLPSDLHEITHGSVWEYGTPEALADCAAWHVGFYARLIEKLRDTVDIDGGSLLDSSAIVLAFEGGWGYDHETGGSDSPHSTENMVMLVGGGAGGLSTSPGGHIRTDRQHPAAVLNSVLKALGSNETLGEVTDFVDDIVV